MNPSSPSLLLCSQKQHRHCQNQPPTTQKNNRCFVYDPKQHEDGEGWEEQDPRKQRQQESLVLVVVVIVVVVDNKEWQ